MKLPGLTSRQARFVEEYLVDGNGTAAAVRSGYAPRSAHVRAARLMKDKCVAEALQVSRRREATRLELDRQRVMHGLLEAVEVARARRDAGAMITGWREIGRLMGYYQPEVRRVEVTATARGMLERLEALPDDELLAMATGLDA